MAEYTYKDIIIDPNSEEAKNAVGKEVFFDDIPRDVVIMANANANGSDLFLTGVLKDVIPELPYPFRFEDGNRYSCIIVKKEEPKSKYIPFESAEEFIKAFGDHTHSDKDSNIKTILYMSGMWLITTKREIPAFEQVIAIQDMSVLFGTTEYSYPALLENFTFIDGSPCGKEVEE